jgi:hypothetical protein
MGHVLSVKDQNFMNVPCIFKHAKLGAMWYHATVVLCSGFDFAGGGGLAVDV